MKRFFSTALTFLLMSSLFACGGTKTVPASETEEPIALKEGAAFQLVENIEIKGSAFYLYSPSSPHNFSMLSGFLNSVIFVYLDVPCTTEAAALAGLRGLGLSNKH